MSWLRRCWYRCVTPPVIPPEPPQGLSCSKEYEEKELHGGVCMRLAKVSADPRYIPLKEDRHWKRKSSNIY